MRRLIKSKSKSMFVKGWFSYSFVNDPDKATNYVFPFLRTIFINILNKKYRFEYKFQPANMLPLKTNVSGKNKVGLK